MVIAITMTNFIQYSHYQVVKPVWINSLRVKAFVTIRAAIRVGRKTEQLHPP